MDVELGFARILFREFLDGRQGLQKELGADFVEVDVNKEFSNVTEFLFELIDPTTLIILPIIAQKMGPSAIYERFGPPVASERWSQGPVLWSKETVGASIQ